MAHLPVLGIEAAQHAFEADDHVDAAEHGIEAGEFLAGRGDDVARFGQRQDTRPSSMAQKKLREPSAFIRGSSGQK